MRLRAGRAIGHHCHMYVYGYNGGEWKGRGVVYGTWMGISNCQRLYAKNGSGFD